MNRRFKIITAALVLAGLLIIVFGSFALADTAATNTGCTGNGGHMGGGGHGMGGYFGQGVLGNEVVTDLLGLSTEEIQAQRVEGKSLVEIAAARGIGEDALVAAILEARTAHIQESVANGTLTQEQAQIMLQHMGQNIIWMVNQTGTGPFDGGHGHGQSGMAMGAGGMHRWAQAD